MGDPNFHLRVAQLNDAPVLHELIAASVQELMVHAYTVKQLEGALGVWLGLDTQLIIDGTYYVIEVNNPDSSIVACGGWSRRNTLYGSDNRPNREDTLLDPRVDAARIRAFFVHPDWNRRGLGSILLRECESVASSEGFTKLELGATLSGIPLYERHGYICGEKVELPLPGGDSLAIVRMEKRFNR